MSPQRPDLVDVWVFRLVQGQHDQGPPDQHPLAQDPHSQGLPGQGRLEILLLHRAPGDILAGLWQGVSGSLEAGERVTDGALRELNEETGFGPAEIDAFFHLDQVNQFHVAAIDAILTAAVFAVRISPTAEPTLSDEHDALRWASADEALATLVWPEYRTSIVRIRDDLQDPERAPWFELTLAGQPVRP